MIESYQARKTSNMSNEYKNFSCVQTANQSWELHQHTHLRGEISWLPNLWGVQLPMKVPSSKSLIKMSFP